MNQKRLLSAAAGAALLVSLMSGCTGNGAGNATPSPAATPVPLPAGVPADVVQETAGIPRDTVLFTVNGNPVLAEDFLYYVSYSCDSISQYMALDWTQDVDGMTMADYMLSNAMETAKLYSVVTAQAKEKGYTISEEDQADYDAQLTQMKTYLASQSTTGDPEAEFQRQLARMGISQDAFTRINETPYLFESIQAALYGDVTDVPAPTDEELSAWMTETSTMRAKHILVKAVPNAESGDDGMAAALEKANAIREELRAAGDTEAKFDELMTANSEDTAADGSLNGPDGYTFNQDTSFVQEFKDGTAALTVGQISEPVQSTYGYHILLRLDPDVTEATTMYTDSKSQTQATDISTKMQETTKQWVSEAKVETTEAYTSLDPQAFYTALLTLRDTINAAAQPTPAPTAAPEGTAAPAPTATPAA